MRGRLLYIMDVATGDALRLATDVEIILIVTTERSQACIDIRGDNVPRWYCLCELSWDERGNCVATALALE